MNIGLDMSKQNGLNCVDVAYIEDFDATGDHSDTGNSLVCGTVGYGTMIV